MPIKEVIIDRRLLDTFKRKALKKYPIEYAQALWGMVEKDTALVYALEPVEVENATENSIDFQADYDYGDKQNGYVLLGSLHSHPDSYCTPSEEDIADAKLEKELVFGICAITKKGKRRFVSYGFFTPEGEQVELTVGE